MTNLRGHCLIGSTDGKNENGCVSNEKTPLALICQSRLQSRPHYSPPRSDFLLIVCSAGELPLTLNTWLLPRGYLTTSNPTCAKPLKTAVMNDTSHLGFPSETAIICINNLKGNRTHIMFLWACCKKAAEHVDDRKRRHNQIVSAQGSPFSEYI